MLSGSVKYFLFLRHPCKPVKLWDPCWWHNSWKLSQNTWKRYHYARKRYHYAPNYAITADNTMITDTVTDALRLLARGSDHHHLASGRCAAGTDQTLLCHYTMKSVMRWRGRGGRGHRRREGGVFPSSMTDYPKGFHCSLWIRVASVIDHCIVYLSSTFSRSHICLYCWHCVMNLERSQYRARMRGNE